MIQSDRFCDRCQNHIRGVIVNDREKIEADQVVLAVGHSARDTFEKLLERKITMEPKRLLSVCAWSIRSQ